MSAISVTSSVISNEARQILNGEVGLSDSMLAVMNGDDPTASAAPAANRNSETEVVQASVLTPVSVDSYLSDITEEESAGSSFGISLVGCSLGTRMIAANDFSKVPSMLITLCP